MSEPSLSPPPSPGGSVIFSLGEAFQSETMRGGWGRRGWGRGAGTRTPAHRYWRRGPRQRQPWGAARSCSRVCVFCVPTRATGVARRAGGGGPCQPAGQPPPPPGARRGARARTRVPRPRTHPTSTRTPGARRLGGVGGAGAGGGPLGKGRGRGRRRDAAARREGPTRGEAARGGGRAAERRGGVPGWEFPPPRPRSVRCGRLF